MATLSPWMRQPTTWTMVMMTRASMRYTTYVQSKYHRRKIPLKEPTETSTTVVVKSKLQPTKQPQTIQEKPTKKTRPRPVASKLSRILTTTKFQKTTSNLWQLKLKMTSSIYQPLTVTVSRVIIPYPLFFFFFLSFQLTYLLSERHCDKLLLLEEGK